LSAEPIPYKVFEKDGSKADFEEILDKAMDCDVILFGELHNNSMAHWLELQLAKELAKYDTNLVLGAEMFETDTQILLDEYFAGNYPTKNFEDEAKVWKNYPTDYKPIVEFAKSKKLRFIATNVPRRYAAFTSRNGLDALPKLEDEAKKYLAPLPIKYDSTLPGYKNMSEMAAHSGQVKYLAEAQALKDATMANSIITNMKKSGHFLHYNGAYHSDNFEGINWYLKLYKPDIKILTITVIETDNVKKLPDESKNTADFIICIPDDMTKTY
jgi:uncharacterized iron-regulated protein